MTWPELSEILNKELRGTDEPWLDSSAYRKPFATAKKYYDNVFSQMDMDEYSGTLAELKRELEKEKRKVQTEKMEYNRWLREDARDELIVEKIEEAIQNLSPITIPEKHHTTARLDSCSDKGWVLAFGDAHFGSEFKIKGLRGETINEYSPEVFYERMETLLNRVAILIEEEAIPSLHVFDMGDHIDGLLRVSQIAKLRYGVVDASIKYAQYLGEWLNKLSAYCPITFATCYGNHSELRMLGQPKGTFKEDNMGKVIVEFIKLYTRDNPDVDIHLNETGMIFENIKGFNILGFHGESKNLEQTMKDFSKIYMTDIDILIAGHLHHTYNETVGICSDVIRTPSIIGVDDFSMKLYKSSNPGATLFAIDELDGRVMDHHIKL